MKLPHCVLFEQHGLVFETHRPDQWWSAGEGACWRQLGDNAPDLHEIVVGLCFMLPPLTADPGEYRVIALVREASGEAAELRLEVVYDAHNALFSIRTAATDPREETQEETHEETQALVLEGWPASCVANRVLRLAVMVKKDSICLRLESEDQDDELYCVAESHGHLAWLEAAGTSAAGRWHITSGEPRGESVLAFPPGFGLADVQVILHGEPRRGERFLPYSGALDAAGCWLDDELNGLTRETGRLVRDMETWLGRTHRIHEGLEVLSELSPRLARSLLAYDEEGGEVNPY